MNKKFSKDFIPSILLSFATGFMLFFFAPLEIYFNNMYEFWFDFYILFPVCLLMFVMFLLGCTVGFAILYKMNIRIYRYGVILFLLGFCCTYIQGNYMAGSLPQLDGSTIDWSRYGTQHLASILLWIVVGILILVAVRIFSSEKVVAAAGVIGTIITLILLVTLITVGIMQKGLTKKLNIGNSMNYALEMSDNQNFVILLLDAVDGETMTKLVEEHPEYADTFSDFTYYSNTMGSYPYTVYALPYILSGEWYENQEEYMEYGKRVYREAPIFKELEQRGYRMGLYEPEAFRLEESMLRFENMVNDIGDIASYSLFVKLELKLVGFKYMPYGLKKYCVTIPAEFEGLRTMDEEAFGRICTTSNKDLFNYLQETQVTLTDEKCFRFFHVEGGHAPWAYDAEMNEIENSTYEQCVEASMTIASTYIQKLQESGVYDNTAIMIISDHGYNPEDVSNSFGRQDPILFVKGVGEHHDTMQISEAPISQSDYAEAYLRLLDGKTGQEVFDYQEGDSRERRYLYVETDKLGYFSECIQTGYAWDVDTMIFTGKEIVP